jgi:hypothetical protein
MRALKTSALATVLALISAAAASAAVPGLERVVGQSEFNSVNVKAQGAPCTPGKRLLGMGGDINNGLGQVEMDRLRPGLFGSTVIAVEDQDGTTNNWFVRTYSICADPLPGLQIVSETGPSNSRNKHITATCPAGKRVVGTGGEILGEESRVVLNGLEPTTDLTQVRVRGAEDQNEPTGDWALRAYAICAQPPPGLELAPPGVSANNSAPFKSASAACDPGKRLVGLGGRITGGTPVAGQVVLDDLTPNPALTGVTVGAREDQDGVDEDWRVHAFAICANA